MIDLGPFVRAGSGTAAGIHPLAAVGMPSRHTWLIWIVLASPTGVRHALAFVAERVGIAH